MKVPSLAVLGVLLLAGMTTAGASSSTTTTSGTGTYTNPVVQTNSPDPGVLLLNGTYWMVSTAGSSNAFPLRSSPDLVNWTEEGFTFKENPSCKVKNAPRCDSFSTDSPSRRKPYHRGQRLLLGSRTSHHYLWQASPLLYRAYESDGSSLYQRGHRCQRRGPSSWLSGCPWRLSRVQCPRRYRRYLLSGELTGLLGGSRERERDSWNCKRM